MSRAGPVSQAGVSLPGSRHICYMQQKSTGRAQLAEIAVSLSGAIPANRAEIFPCNRVCRVSPVH